MRGARAGFLAVALALAVVSACNQDKKEPAQPTGAKVVASNPKWVETKVDVFPGMDGPNLNLDADDIRGRIVWNLWCGDSGLLWDYLAQHGFGTSDLLKTIDSRGRTTRFADIGIINQPGFTAATRPDPYGLWIDIPKPGDADGAIDEKVDFYTYGRSSGVVGLRLFDNPKFDPAAKAEWMKHVKNGVNEDFYNNPAYFNQPSLVRP